MKSKLIACLVLLSGSFGVAFSETNAAFANMPVSPAGQTYRSRNYGFQFDVPDGWTTKETAFDIRHYSSVFLTVNNQRPELEIRDWPVGKNSREFSSKTTFQQMHA